MPSGWKSKLVRAGHGGLHPDELEIGSVSGVFGVRGELRLHLHNRDSQILEEGQDVVLIDPSGERFTARLRSRSGAGRRVIGRIEGIDRRELAEQLVGVAIALPQAELPEPVDGEYYLDEVIGMGVRSGDRVHGRVIAVHTTGPVDVFELDTGAYLPSTAENILSIDRSRRIIEVAEGAVHAL